MGDYRIIVRRIKINTLFLFLFEGRSPFGKLHELLIGTMIISLFFIQFGDFRHFFLSEGEIQYIQIVLDVIHIFASWDHYESHLGVPAEDYLRGTLAVFLSELSENRFKELGYLYKDSSKALY